MMDYAIRPATLDDVAGIADVAHRTWDLTYARIIASHNRRQFIERVYTPEGLQEAIEGDRAWFYVAILDQEIVGYAHFLRRSDSQGELVRIYVHPDHQRHGIGRAFLSAGAAAMAITGVSLCFASMEANNAGAHAFYRRFGFRQRRDYAQFLGDQLIKMVEMKVSVGELQEKLGEGSG